jgi:radical SAM superfamily enzyme YgiQ (UPF0313 family)
MHKGSANTILLIHPPYGDFTRPYHSLSYVKTPLVKAGFHVIVLDLNIMWFKYVFSKDWLQQQLGLFMERVKFFEKSKTLSIKEQEEYVNLIQGIQLCRTIDTDRCLKIMKTELFYEYPEYLSAQTEIKNFEKVLTIAYNNFYNFQNSFSIPEYLCNSQDLVANVNGAGKLTSDLRQLISDKIKDLDILFCGISFPFSSHLLPGMSAFKAFRSLRPETRLIAGGTAITDLYKYRTNDEALLPLSTLFDDMYIGEAELSIVSYALSIKENTPLPRCREIVDLTSGSKPDANESPTGIQYISLGGKEGRKGLNIKPFDWYHNIPSYDWIDWEDYLSPDKIVNYSPVRGCFWNKCTFCDYGLNTDSPAAPSRTMQPKVAVQHIKELLIEHNIRYFYLAVDAIEPSFLKNFAILLIESGIKISWFTEIFITKSFNSELIGLLQQSGMITASFGLESGSSRVLELMGKGARRVEEILLPVFEAFKESSIGLQPKYFIGFPGETDFDRSLTKEILLFHREVFSLVTKANLFILTTGSLIAKQPDKYGISRITRKDNDNIGGNLIYDVATPKPCHDDLAVFNEGIGYPDRYERPWAGGIDSFHTALYLEYYDKHIFNTLAGLGPEANKDYFEVSIPSFFDLEQMFANVYLFNTYKSEHGQELLKTIAGGALPSLIQNLSAEMTQSPKASVYSLKFR